MRGRLASLAACALALATFAGCTSSASSSPPSGSAAAATSRTTPAPAPALAAGKHAMVTYCNHQKARILEPATLHGPAPAVLYIHGGSWVAGNFDSGGFISNTIGPDLAAKGFVVVGIDYRLGPARWPDQIVDVKCAVRYLRANARALSIDPNEIGVWGWSAGGHLAALLGTAGRSAGWDVGAYAGEASKVQAVVDMAGPSDLLTLGDQGGSGEVGSRFASLLGHVTQGQLDAELRADSPVTHIAPGDPPFLILHSTNDVIVYPQQSLELSWDLGANAVPHQLLLVQGGGHSFTTAGESPSEDAIVTAIVEFFVKTLVFHQPIASN